MSEKINNLIEELKSLTLLEAAELVKEIESVFGVDASFAATVPSAFVSSDLVNDDKTAQAEQLEFDVILEEVPVSKKIAVLKVVRSITGLGLKDAKTLVESTPKVVKEAVTKEDANEISNKLKEAGATVSIK